MSRCRTTEQNLCCISPETVRVGRPPLPDISPRVPLPLAPAKGHAVYRPEPPALSEHLDTSSRARAGLMNGDVPSPQPRHLPVMPAEVLEQLAPAPGQTLVDATVGAGGHTRLLAERVGPAGRVIGLDQDPGMLDLARPRLEGQPVTLVQANFEDLRRVLDELGVGTVHGVLADLGFSSDQMEAAERGFSFGRPGPLDMRMDPARGEPAEALLRRLSERDLAD